MGRKGVTTVVAAMLLIFMVTPVGLLVYRMENPSIGNMSDQIANNTNSGNQGNTNISQGETDLPQANAGFGWDPDDPRAGERIDFVLVSEQSYDSVSWSFGDGNSSTQREPSHVYSSEGEYTVELEVEAGESSDTETRTVNIAQPRKEPIARLNYTPRKIVKDKSVVFDAYQSKDPDGQIEEYYWDLGDGFVDGGVEFTHSFNSSGTKTVRLKVTDESGLNDTESMDITVEPPNNPPIPEVTYSPDDPRIEENITFDASDSRDPDGQIEEYYWSFDRGIFDNGTVTRKKMFENSGNYTFRLKVVDNEGGSAVIERFVNISPNEPPTVSVDHTPENPSVDQKVEFSAEADDVDGEVAKYEWDLNRDGEYEKTGASQEYYFISSGKKKVRLRVTDNSGGVTEKTVDVKVSSPTNDPPEARFEYNVHVLRSGEITTFDASKSSDPDGSIETYEWDWTNNGKYSGGGESVNNALHIEGEKKISLRVTDDEGATDTATKSVRIVPEECKKMRIQGELEKKADILLVARNYESDSAMMDDFQYYMDFDQEHRGLFDVYPMNVSMDKFNVWTLDAGVGNIGDYGDGLVTDSTDYFNRCSFADYKVLMSKDGFSNNGFATSNNRMFIPDVASKVEQDNGAVALIHEWGHGFAGLKDEYYSADGRDASGQPNCAPTREEAELWWGNMAENNPNVGYYQGCAYNDDNWRPHEKSIMGNGGLWHYGPVNDRRMLKELDKYE